MDLTSYYKMFRGASSCFNLWGHGTRLSGSISSRSVKDNTLARSVRADTTPSAQRSGKEDGSSREEHNRTIIGKTSPALIHLEKNLLPLFVLNFYLEDAILKRFSDHDKMSTKTTPVNVFQRTSFQPEYLGSTTAVEFKEMMAQGLFNHNMEKSTSPPYMSRTNTDEKEVKNGGLLPFVTKLPTFRQQGVPPQAGFASTAEKTTENLSNQLQTVPVMKHTATKLEKGMNDAKTSPVVEGSVQDGSFSKVTRVNIFREDPNSVGLASTVKGLAAEASSETKDVMPPKANIKEVDNTELGCKEVASAQEFLKYQTVSSTEPPETKVDRRVEAEMKACAVVTQNGSLRDAQTLIEFSKSRYAPRSLMNLKECVDYQCNDYKTQALLQKYKLLKLREVDYHHAQIKKHRKMLLELMFKTPYQKPEDPSKPP